MNEALIQVKNLNFEYPGVKALDNVSFDINKGSITALVGPNGAGKSTLLRCIAALDYPLSGTISLDGRDVFEDPRASHAKIGYLSDNFGLYETLTVRQCLYFSAASQGVAEQDIEEVVESTALQLKMTDKLDAMAGNLSRGQKQRVAIGQSIIHSPDLLLLDEPASGLDPEARHSLSQVFITLKDGGMTLMVSSHILAELEDYSTDMLVLKGGVVVQHQAENENAQQATDTMISFELADSQASTSTAKLLENVIEVSQVIVKGDLVSLQLNEALMPRNKLLSHLVKSNIALNKFVVVDQDMQASYLNAVKEKGAKNV